ncbi:hypothetical protein HY485_00340 [Candidatus Woesearchaeota archaeon]|nr:hypothetical protein [Candidatus Woesearchaeota archaeon]
MLWTLRPVGGGVLQHLITMEETKMTAQNVLKEGIDACEMLEKVISRLKNRPPVVETSISCLIGECNELAAEVEAHPENESAALKNALGICFDALDAVAADYRQMAAGLHEKLEKYK